MVLAIGIALIGQGGLPLAGAEDIEDAPAGHLE